MGDAFFVSHWKRTKRARTDARVEGKVCVRKVDSRIQVSAPYRDEFVTEARKLGGRWRYRSEVWSFPGSVIRELDALITRIYGEFSYMKD